MAASHSFHFKAVLGSMVGLQTGILMASLGFPFRSPTVFENEKEPFSNFSFDSLKAALRAGALTIILLKWLLII